MQQILVMLLTYRIAWIRFIIINKRHVRLRAPKYHHIQELLIQKIEIATTGNGVDFGDTFVAHYAWWMYLMVMEVSK
jgi:hypothetical protein